MAPANSLSPRSSCRIISDEHDELLAPPPSDGAGRVRTGGGGVRAGGAMELVNGSMRARGAAESTLDWFAFFFFTENFCFGFFTTIR